MRSARGATNTTRNRAVIVELASSPATMYRQAGAALWVDERTPSRDANNDVVFPKRRKLKIGEPPEDNPQSGRGAHGKHGPRNPQAPVPLDRVEP